MRDSHGKKQKKDPTKEGSKGRIQTQRAAAKPDFNINNTVVSIFPVKTANY